MTTYARRSPSRWKPTVSATRPDASFDEVIQLEPQEAQPEQGPPAQQTNPIRPDAAATLRGRDPIADARSMLLDRFESDRTDEPVTGRIGHRQGAVAPL